MADELIDPCKPKVGSLSLNGTPVTVIIGKEKHPLLIHDTSLTQSSKFFQTALKKEWAEGQRREVRLPDESVDTVTTYLQWLYSGAIASKTNGQDKQQHYLYLARLYVLGEKLIDPEFQNRVIDAIVASSRETWGPKQTNYPLGDAVSYIYQNTMRGDLARQLVVDMWHDNAVTGWFEHSAIDLDFMEDLVVSLIDCRSLPAASKLKGKSLKKGVPSAYYKKQSS